jgi:hypothetical protein
MSKPKKSARSQSAESPHRTVARTDKPKQPSDKLVAAARANGKRGGRPRKDRHLADFAAVPTPPREPVQLAHWLQHILSIDAQRVRQRRASAALSRELRAYGYAMSKLTRPVIILAAADPDGAWWREASLDAAPINHPAGMAYWLLLALADGVHRCIRGEPDSGAELRATVAVFVKALPPDTLHDAQSRILGEMKQLEAQAGPALQPAEVTDGDAEYPQAVCR